MKQKSADSQLSPFRTRFREQIKSSKLMFTVLIIINLLGVPLTVVSAEALSRMLHYTGWSYSINTVFNVLEYTGILFTAASVLSGAVCALKIFSYYLNKQKADTVFSLPADRKSLFKADWLAGFVIYIVPAIISAVSGTLIVIIYPLKALSKSRSHPYIFLAFIMVSVIIAMILFYCYSVLCIVHSSSAASAFINILLINTAVYFTVYLSGNCIQKEAFGFYFVHTSFFAPFSIVKESFSYEYLLHPVILLLINLITAAAVYCWTYRTGIRKRPETISEKFSQPGLYCLLVFLSSACLIMIQQENISLPVSAAIVLIAFIIAEYKRKKKISRKSFSTVYPSVCMISAVLAVAALPYVSEKTGVFGANNYIPENNIIDVTEISGDIPGYEGPVSVSSDENPEIRELVKKLHNKIIESEKSDSVSYINCSNFSIRYTLKDGRVIDRNYCLPKSELIREAAADIGASEFIKNQNCKTLKNYLLSSKYIDVTYVHYQYPDYSEYWEYTKNYKYEIPVDNYIHEFLNVFYKDIQSATKEELMNSTKSQYSISRYGQLPSCYEKTIKYIQENFCKEEYLKNIEE